MEIEEIWGDIAKSCTGKKIVEIELVSIIQALRIVFENNTMIDLTSCWRYSTQKSILIGAMDIGFFHITPDSEEEMNALIKEQDEFHYKKLNTLLGRTLNNIIFNEREVILEISGKRTIDWFLLSRDDIGFTAIDDYDQR